MSAAALRILLLTSVLVALGNLTDNKAQAASAGEHMTFYYEEAGAHRTGYEEYPEDEDDTEAHIYLLIGGRIYYLT